MITDGKAGLFVPSGVKDGPLPTFYEPVESPAKNLLYGQQDNPAAKKWDRDDNPYNPVGDPRYPYVITTYRLTEHHAGGIPTRFVPTLAELQPNGFAEIPTELAKELGIENLDWVVLTTARGEIETRALVTDRLAPLMIGGQSAGLCCAPSLCSARGSRRRAPKHISVSQARSSRKRGMAMDENKTGENQAQDQEEVIRNLAEEAYKAVETAPGLVPIKCLSLVDFAERAIVRMRDALIDELRREPNKDEKYRHALERANVALSMVVGVEYPATGSQQKSLQMACDVLREARDDLQEPR